MSLEIKALDLSKLQIQAQNEALIDLEHALETAEVQQKIDLLFKNKLKGFTCIDIDATLFKSKIGAIYKVTVTKEKIELKVTMPLKKMCLSYYFENNQLINTRFNATDQQKKFYIQTLKKIIGNLDHQKMIITFKR